VCLKSRRKKKKPWLGLGSLEPAAIRFTLKRLQESARRSSNFFFLFLCICIHRTLESDLLSLSTPSGTKWIFVFIMVYHTTCVPHYMCTTLPVYHTTCVLHYLCTTLHVYHTTCVPHYLCTTLHVYHTTCVPHYMCTTLHVYHTTCVPHGWCKLLLFLSIVNARSLRLQTFALCNIFCSQTVYCVDLKKCTWSLKQFCWNKHLETCQHLIEWYWGFAIKKVPWNPLDTPLVYTVVKS